MYCVSVTSSPAPNLGNQLFPISCTQLLHSNLFSGINRKELLSNHWLQNNGYGLTAQQNVADTAAVAAYELCTAYNSLFQPHSTLNLTIKVADDFKNDNSCCS